MAWSCETATDVETVYGGADEPVLSCTGWCPLRRTTPPRAGREGMCSSPTAWSGEAVFPRRTAPLTTYWPDVPSISERLACEALRLADSSAVHTVDRVLGTAKQQHERSLHKETREPGGLQVTVMGPAASVNEN